MGYHRDNEISETDVPTSLDKPHMVSPFMACREEILQNQLGVPLRPSRVLSRGQG